MKTLRAKILLYFATVTTIMIFLLVVLVRGQIKNTNLPLTIDLSQQIITAKSGEVGAWIRQRIVELQVLTENETLISMDMDKIKPYMRKMDESHNEDFESFAIITLDGQAWVTNDTYIDVNNRPYFEEIKAGNLDYIVSDPIISRSNDEPIVVIIHAIRDASGNPVGYINGAIYVSKLSTIASEVRMYNGLAWICDRNGQVFTTDEEYINKSFNIFESEAYSYEGAKHIGGKMVEGIEGIDRIQDSRGNNIIVLYTPIPYAEGWFLGIHFLEKDMTQDTDKLLQMILVFGFFIIASLIVISLFLSASIVKPVKELQGLMKDVEGGNLDIVYSNPREDEIGQLGEGFNKMVGQIKNLIHTVYIEQKNKREAELKALQAQIQPHFLYNTLDTIQWMALEHQAHDIVDMVDALTNLFRISLSGGEEIISCAEEIKHIESYLFVQKVRYEDKLEYEIIWDEQLKECKVLKLVIQPLVENAIYHGIKRKKGPGRILIIGRILGKDMEVSVIDDGIGIEHKKRLQIMDVLEGRSKGEGTGYGMFNVNERIKLMFGEEYGIHITSEYGQGTEVVLRHPLINMDNKDMG
ncbi:cache domain-containing sensor histidine kinase [Alkaliphilus oremlandii]|uniref:histidine kinase n=1 Tax=Alkaliphilus oremlandii (strain OhILAs) TaxID=350688 RepID=A8MKS8_ALKOO|nr:sensor histidine kinase [Alkaliphilus oremlandii]ABW17745.1 integral membrane sensor signal transduction histidine kinase [Alkaliphilus oremlandii OhILAs]